jgi:hypothetical protein
MNKRKLLKLADLLEEDAEKKYGIKFDLRTWGSVGNKERPLSCRTHACAMGLAALSGKFGISYKIDLGYVIFDLNRYGHLSGFGAAAEAFEIDGLTADWLFSSNSYRLKRGARAELQVAARIRKFVKTDCQL